MICLRLQENDVDESGRNGELMGIKYFNCKPGKGKFAILASLKPDNRNRKNSGNISVSDSGCVHSNLYLRCVYRNQIKKHNYILEICLFYIR